LKVKNAKKVKWSSSDASVAKVSKKGKVTGVKGGNATITGKVDKKSYTCAVTVEQVSFKSDAPTAVVVNGAVDLSTYVEVAPASLKVKWTSSSESIAKVESGKVTGVAQGTATITVASEDGKASAKLDVTVKPAAEEKKDDPNVIVINDDNFTEQFKKYFGRVVITELYLDKNGNVLNPENYIAGSVRTDKETAKFNGANNDPDEWVDYATRIGDYTTVGSKGHEDDDYDLFNYYPVMNQTYAYYVKDPTIYDLLTYGGSMMQYHLNLYAVDITGSRPIFASTFKSTVPLGAVTPNTYQTGYGSVMVNASEKVSLARMFFPKAGATKIYYDYRTQHNGYRRMAQGTKLVLYTEDAKLQTPVTGIDNKAMLGFDFAHVRTTFGRDRMHEPWKQHSKVNFNELTDELKSVDMLILEDDVFRNVDFHLYKNTYQK
jgi:hypothetical protein